MRRALMLVIFVGLMGPVVPSAFAANVWVSVEDGRYGIFSRTPVGAQVRFVWNEHNREPHTVTSYAGQSFDSGLRLDGSMDVTFEGVPTLFRCELHSTLDEQGACDGMCGILEDDTEPPPPPTITSPTPDQVVGASIVRIEGTAALDVDEVSVRADGEYRGWARAPAGAWALGIYLEQGPRTIEVRAWDRYNNASEPVSLSFTVHDDTPPAVPVFIDPADGATLPQPYTASVEVDDDTAHVVFSSEDPPFEAWVWPQNGIATTQLSEAGAYTLLARAYDHVGNVSDAASVDVIVDASPPQLTVTQPSSASVSAGPPLVAGTAGDNLEVATVAITAIDRARGTIHVFDAECDGCGTPEATWQLLVPLETGWYTISVAATDGVGNQVESRDRYVLVL